MTDHLFSTKAFLSKSWDSYTKNAPLMIAIIVTTLAINILLTLILDELMPSYGYIVLGLVRLVSVFINLFFIIGVIKIVLKIVHDQPAQYADIFSGKQYLLHYFAGYILFAFILLAGFILLIVPGIIWTVQFSFYPFCIVDKNLGPIDALKASSKLTQGYKWDLFGFLLLIIAINIAGALLLGIGLLVSLPVSILAYGYIYRQLSHS